MKKIDTIPAAIETLTRLEKLTIANIVLAVFNAAGVWLILERIFV